MRQLLQNYLFLSMFCVSFTLSAQGDNQFEVYGVVKDSVTQETLPFANIFFSGTTFGTVSDKEGNFSLKATSPGTYDLVISFTGYKTYFQQIDLNQPTRLKLEVTMSPESTLIGGVTVTAKKDEKWRRNLQVFKEIFLGTSDNAEDCKILNEEVLNFDYDNKERVFEAYAGEPLIIENKALGYRITYLLESFMIYYKYNFSSFYGFPSFKDLNKEGKSKKRWAKARDEAYYGSVDHFYRELYRGNTFEAGFRINYAKDVEGVGRMMDINEFDIQANVQLQPEGVRKELTFEDILYINYIHESPAPQYRPSRRSVEGSEAIEEGGQLSWITMSQGIDAITFEKSGYLINPLAFVIEGYWSFEKVGDLLPTNYEPSETK